MGDGQDVDRDRRPGRVASDGVSAATVTVTLLDLGGDPVSGKAVGLNADGSAVVAHDEVKTNANGVATFRVTDTHGEIVTFTAVDKPDKVTLAQQASATFADLPSATLSALTVDKTSIASTGKVYAVVTAHLVDAAGHSLTSALVSLQASSGHPQIEQGHDNHGHLDNEFAVSDTNEETVTFTATDARDGITLTQTVTITSSRPAAANHSSVSVSPQSVAADGTTAATVTVTFETSSGSPAAGKEVELDVQGQQVRVAGGHDATTDANGVATFTLSSPRAQTVTISAKDLSDSQNAAPGKQAVEVGTPATTLTFT